MPCFSESLVFQGRNLWGQTTVRYAHNINVSPKAPFNWIPNVVV